MREELSYSQETQSAPKGDDSSAADGKADSTQVQGAAEIGGQGFGSMETAPVADAVDGGAQTNAEGAGQPLEGVAAGDVEVPIADESDFSVSTGGAIINLQDAEREIQLVTAAREDQSLRDNAPLTNPDEVLSHSNEIIMSISRTRFDEAWRRMRTNTAIPPKQLDSFIRGYDSHFVRVIQNFGPSVGVELISQEMSGVSMMKISYLVKYEVTGVAWFMYFTG